MTGTGKQRLPHRWMMKALMGISLIIVSFTAVSCSPASSTAADVADVAVDTEPLQPAAAADGSSLTTAIFAGGCFWCMEGPFDALPGVSATVSGYTGGSVENPTYSQVSAGNTGHTEAMQVTYDPTQVSYETLLETFWYNIDPLDGSGQFCDKGSQYRSAIFYDTSEQQSLAAASKQAIAKRLKQPIATEITPASTFYPAEDYHQNYYLTRPVRYKVYRYGCGRDQRLSELWGADAPAHE